MGKCKCWEERSRWRAMYDPHTGKPWGGFEETYAICNGTREQDECSCGGDEDKCDFYEEVRARAEKSVEKVYTVDEVAQILADALSDECACNLNGNDEWLPHICEHQDTCPNTVGKNECWKQYLKWVGEKDRILEEHE